MGGIRPTGWKVGRAAALAAALLLATGVSHAQTAVEPAALSAPAPGADLSFTQAGVPAEATAENAVLARDNAFASARRLAWDRMLAEAGVPARAMSAAQLERMVTSMVIEQERVSPTRYTGRVTVNFAPGAVRSALGRAGSGGSAGGGEAAAGGGAAGVAPGSIGAPPRPGPPVTSLDVVASYRSLAEWLELRRRLQGAAPVAGVDVRGLALDAARLRLALRQQPPEAAAELAGLGVQLVPDAGAAGPVPVAGGPGGTPAGAWRVRLGGG